MPEFLQLSSPSEALEILVRSLPHPNLVYENIRTVDSRGRILGVNITAPHPLPEFPRSSVDGYAVHSRDTFGVTESQPGYLWMVGEVPMGLIPAFSLGKGTCALIHTGGMVPTGSDAVIMLENTQIIRDSHVLELDSDNQKPSVISEVEITKAVAEGENIIQIGEDVAKDSLVLKAGTKIRPVEIGGCMALGFTTISVVVKPRIGLLSCGDEIIQPDMITNPGQVRDVNSYSLASLINESGGEPIFYGIIPDDLAMVKEVSKKALEECDVVVITAGSSASERDTTATAIASLGLPGVLVHGINIRPGKPTILAVCNGKPVIGLPGNPVSALVIGKLYLVPVIEYFFGLTCKQPTPTIRANLAVNLPSQIGREDWIPVKVLENDLYDNLSQLKYIALPVFGKSNLIFSLSKADGLVRIPVEVSGFPAGEIVEVMLI